MSCGVLGLPHSFLYLDISSKERTKLQASLQRLSQNHPLLGWGNLRPGVGCGLHGRCHRDPILQFRAPFMCRGLSRALGGHKSGCPSVFCRTCCPCQGTLHRGRAVTTSRTSPTLACSHPSQSSSGQCWACRDHTPFLWSGISFHPWSPWGLLAVPPAPRQPPQAVFIVFLCWGFCLWMPVMDCVPWNSPAHPQEPGRSQRGGGCQCCVCFVL